MAALPAVRITHVREDFFAQSAEKRQEKRLAIYFISAACDSARKSSLLGEVWSSIEFRGFEKIVD